MTTYSIQPAGDRACSILLSGDLTASVVPALQGELKQQLATSTEELVFDLGATTMLDSSGIGLLIAAANSLKRRNGRIRVINVSPDILKLLQSMRLAARLNATGRPAQEI